MMARKVAAGAVLLLLLGLLLSSSADAKSTRIRCSFHQAKNPCCDTSHGMDGTCGKQCKSEGYPGWMCAPNCTCMVCPSLELEHRQETMKLQKQAAGNRGAPPARAGAV